MAGNNDTAVKLHHVLLLQCKGMCLHDVSAKTKDAAQGKASVIDNQATCPTIAV